MTNFIEEIRSAWTEHTRATEGREAPSSALPYVYASQWRRCDRAMALDLIYPGDRGKFDDTTLERFARGNEIERMIVARLSLAGRYGQFTIEASQQRFELLGRDLHDEYKRPKIVIVGKIDGMIRFASDPKMPIPFDVKSGAAVQSVNTLDDLFAGRWTRHMPYQLLAYCYMTGSERGLLIIDKPSGPVFIEIVLEEHLDKMESFISSAEIAVGCAKYSAPEKNVLALPDFVDDLRECSTCDHRGKSCDPPSIENDERFQSFNDEETIELAKQLVEHRKSAKLFGSADRALKKKLRGVEIGTIGGEFTIVGKWQKSSSPVYPEKCSKCSAEIVPEKIVDERGRFKLEIEPTSGEERET